MTGDHRKGLLTRQVESSSRVNSPLLWLLGQLLVKMQHREVASAPRTIPAGAGSPRPPPDGLPIRRSRKLAAASSRTRSRQRRNVRSDSPSLATASPAHAARAPPRNASAVPFAVLPPAPFPAP